ncbi:AbrB/MazE/SpoVT family DNA-binding domain-containing protein [Pseudomonas purpurea]|uniref:AbrB/MazE/SpoVT family DNA-binding domain-containing protein n=1 Tax=Pseudomonas purpurea TaxID=3136737 RepID=UPI003266A7FA
MNSLKVTIEDWNGDGVIRIPDAALQELGVDVGDSLYIVEVDAATQVIVLSKTPKLRDRLDDLLETLDSPPGR